jgi:hypothetical protein
LTGHAAQPTGSLSPQVQAGRSPVLDAAQLEVLCRYGTKQDMAELDALDQTNGTDRALERKWW